MSQVFTIITSRLRRLFWAAALLPWILSIGMVCFYVLPDELLMSLWERNGRGARELFWPAYLLSITTIVLVSPSIKALRAFVKKGRERYLTIIAISFGWTIVMWAIVTVVPGTLGTPMSHCIPTVDFQRYDLCYGRHFSIGMGNISWWITKGQLSQATCDRIDEGNYEEGGGRIRAIACDDYGFGGSWRCFLWTPTEERRQSSGNEARARLLAIEGECGDALVVSASSISLTEISRSLSPSSGFDARYLVRFGR